MNRLRDDNRGILVVVVRLIVVYFCFGGGFLGDFVLVDGVFLVLDLFVFGMVGVWLWLLFLGCFFFLW